MRQEHEKTRKAVVTMSNTLGLGEPFPEVDKLAETLADNCKRMAKKHRKRKREEELSTYHGWTDKEEKSVRAMVHPDKDAQHTPAFNAWRSHVLDKMLEAGEH